MATKSTLHRAGDRNGQMMLSCKGGIPLDPAGSEFECYCLLAG
jgi:hypothetical protein